VSAVATSGQMETRGRASDVLRWGVVVFPGTNCEHETLHVLGSVLGQPVRLVWHQETDLSDRDALVVAGGFAHGDYLRAGAVARFSPVMAPVQQFAEEGKPVIGICNGFQVLLEAGLLPGAMLRNRTQNFACRWVNLRVENPASPFLRGCQAGEVLRMPIGHGEGNYFAEPEQLAEMKSRGQVLLRYCDPDGNISDRSNPNGSVECIAGVSNAAGNVMGMMPHPERASEAILGSDDGRKLFESVIHSFARR
jgi:phosphoribosylformylglycinamidine synthase subunit PurQ / glutaminase